MYKDNKTIKKITLPSGIHLLHDPKMKAILAIRDELFDRWLECYDTLSLWANKKARFKNGRDNKANRDDIVKLIQIEKDKLNAELLKIDNEILSTTRLSIPDQLSEVY